MFQPQFVHKIKSGSKTQTVRPVPKRIPKVGDLESWRQWLGKPYRSKQKEIAQVKIIDVRTVTIKRDIIIFGGMLFGDFARYTFAFDDGFNSPAELITWFDKNHGLPFTGIVIKVVCLKGRQVDL
jgi:hypothetical protein